jgi:methylated-DNA-[protein]-cysteine S-methyltransferase
MKGSLTFADRVREIVRGIPQGSVASYGEVARAAGKPRAARAVGGIMARNDDVTVPCHRVIRGDGKIGAYNGLRGKVGPEGKLALLSSEGFAFKKRP